MTEPMCITYREAVKQGIREALQDDSRVFLMGEDVGKYGGCFAVSKGLLDEFGEERIRDTPLSESAFVGAGIGAAMAGMRPIVEIMTVNFSLLAIDQIVNNAATLCHMSGGQFPVPVVIRMATGAGRQLAAQHSHSFEAWYAHVPGLRVVEPATIDDARVHNYCAIEDSVILPNVDVGRGTVLRKAVVDKHCRLPPGFTAGVDAAADRERFRVTEHGVTLVVPEMLGQHVHHLR